MFVFLSFQSIQAIDSNVQYVEQGKIRVEDWSIFNKHLWIPLGDTDEVELEFYLTTPFASG